MGRVLPGEHRRVELDVLEVDQACAHAVGHRHPVAHAPGLVCAVQEDLAQAAAGQDGLLGDDGRGLARRCVEYVGAKTGQGVVLVGGNG